MLPIDILFLASCIYVPLLFLLYLAEIWTPGSPFKGSFYILFVVGAFVDLIFVIDSMQEFRLVFFPLVNGFFDGYECMHCTSIRITITYICPFCQDLLNTFVALNRFTSIRLPVDHAPIWQKLLPISIVFSIVFSIAIFGPAFFRPTKYTKMHLGPDWVMYYTSEDLTFMSWWPTHRMMSIEMITTSIIIIVLYTLAARSLSKLTSDSATKKQERKLLIFGMSNFAIQIVAMFPQLMLDFNFFPIDWIIVVVYQYAWLTDVKTFCASVTMIVVNTTFRKHMLESFGIKFKSKKKTIMVASLSSSDTQSTNVTSRTN